MIAGGILPAAIEMMDALTLEAVEAAVAPGYPAGAGAVLIVELDGPAVQVLEDSAAVEQICRECGSFELRAAETAEERALDLARPQVVVRGDGADLAELLRAGRRRPAHEAARGAAADLRARRASTGCGSRRVFHAGDGNLHPLVLYDDARRGRGRRSPSSVATAILDVCIDAGGSLTGEHGVGVDKACSMPKLFGAERPRGDAAAARRVRPASGSRTRARCSRRRASAARCRGRTAHIRSSGPGLPSVSEPTTVEPRLDRRGGGGADRRRPRLDRPRRAATSCSRRGASTACSSTSRAT